MRRNLSVSASGSSARDEAPATVVCFLGGCTYTELAALRFVSSQGRGKPFEEVKWRPAHIRDRRSQDHRRDDRHHQWKQSAGFYGSWNSGCERAVNRMKLTSRKHTTSGLCCHASNSSICDFRSVSLYVTPSRRSPTDPVRLCSTILETDNPFHALSAICDQLRTMRLGRTHI